MNVFGYTIKKKKDQDDSEKVQSVVVPSSSDGSTLVSSGAAYYGYTFDIEGSMKNEDDLIKRYREVSFYSDCDSAIEDIINEAIAGEEDEQPVVPNLDNLKVSAGVKNKIQEEFKNILNLLDFDEKGHDIFRQWYIDGRIYYNIMLDKNNPSAGIQKLLNVDARKIRKIKNIVKEKAENGVEIVKTVEEYYIYNDKGISSGDSRGIKLSLDSVVYTPSGYIDGTTGMVLSYLHKAIKPVNQLKMIEDAFVIYTISRAPQRRIFYVDVGNLNQASAEKYTADLMAKYRNKIVYDANTGEIRDDKKHQSVLEDYWMPRREGGKGTEITTLEGGGSLIGNDVMQYFQQKLFQSLNVPISRLQPNQGFTLGKSSEITRDEIKFNKFIIRLRKKFSGLFLDLLRVQLIAKNIMSPEEWDQYKKSIRFDYRKDNFFAEFKQNEIIASRINLLLQVDQFVGKYYSMEWVKKNVLMQTDEEIEDEEELMQAEFEENPPVEVAK